MDADAVVIGAGAAGLAAARSLANRSLKVVLLEGRDRVGGRVLSQPVAQIAARAELGAEFIHGQAKETMKLLRDAGIAALATAGESWTCEAGGDLRRDDKDFRSAADALKRAHSLASDESAEQLLRRLESRTATRQIAETARAFVEGFEAADPAIASARAIADELRSGVDSKSARPLGGYHMMFERLHRACVAAGVQICLSTPVRRVAWRPGSVTIDARNGQRELRRIQARAAVVTLPVGVLRHSGDGTEVVFEPDLPSCKREALRYIEMGHAVKVALWFRTAFWERIHNGRYRDAGFFRCEGRPFAVYWTQIPVRSELIIAWAGGPKAVALEGVSQPEVVARALHGFGELVNEPALAQRDYEGGAMHDWSRDPFARGAYSYITVGGGDARAALGAPVDDTLFFAGEATSNDGQGGTVNGALETGERAAREAANSLGTGDM